MVPEKKKAKITALDKACKHCHAIVTHPGSEGETLRSRKTPAEDLLRSSLTKPLPREQMIGTMKGNDRNPTQFFPKHDLAFQVRDHSRGHTKRDFQPAARAGDVQRRFG